MSADKNQYIKNYFKVFEAEYPSFQKAAKYGTGFLILGLLLFYMQYIEVFKGVDIIATVFVLIGIFAFWLWVRPYFFLKDFFYKRPADGDMDTWFLEDLHNIVKPKALEQLRINPSSLLDENIIIIPYPIYYKQASVPDENIFRRAGDDGLYTYSVWAVQILVVTDNFISYYSCIYDWVNDDVSNERTNEYFFEDISSVRNDVEFIDNTFIDNDDKIGDAKVFKLTNMSGDYLTLITEIPSMKTPPSYINNLELLVQALRVMLRNRRFGEEIEPSEADGVEFEVENMSGAIDENTGKLKSTESDKHYFHQQLRKIYDDYSKDLEIIKTGYRSKTKDKLTDEPKVE